LLLSIPASLGLVIASEEIINALFGYGSFSSEDVKITSSALKYFGYGLPAFALIKIFSNFFFARNNTKTPFYISLFIVILNVIISISFFDKFGFIIIPIATSISTWVGVISYIYLLNLKKSLLLKNYLFKSFLKIISSTIIMSFFLVQTLENYTSYLDYTYKFKSIYLLSIVCFAGVIYLLSCYLLGLLKIKNYKVN